MLRQKEYSSETPRRRPKGPRLRFFALLLVLASTLLAGACHEKKQYIIPLQSSAEEQYRFALEQDKAYRSPLRRQRSAEFAPRAIAAYQKVIDEFPEHDLFVNHSKLGIAMIYDKQRKDKKALKMYEELIEQCPNDDIIQIKSLFGAADIYDAMGEHEKAMDAYGQILDRFSQSDNDEFQRIVEFSRHRYQKIREK